MHNVKELSDRLCKVHSFVQLRVYHRKTRTTTDVRSGAGF